MNNSHGGASAQKDMKTNFKVYTDFNPHASRHFINSHLIQQSSMMVQQSNPLLTMSRNKNKPLR